MDVANISKNQAIATLWSRGNLKWKLHAGQLAIDNAYNLILGMLFVGLCSRRLGKSYWAMIKCFEKAIQTPKANVIVASAFLKDVEEFIVPICEEILLDCPDSLRPKWNATKKKFTFKNGSQITLVGLDKNPNGPRGRYCDLFVFDESFIIKDLRKLYSSVVVPLFRHRPGAKAIMISTPGESEESEFFEFCQKAKIEKAYVELTIYDDPRSTPEEIAKLKAECLDPEDFDREYLCKWVTNKRLAITPEFTDEFVFDGSLRDEYFKFYRKYVALDPGVNDPTGFVFGYFDWKRQCLVIEDEDQLQFDEVLTANISNVLNTKEKELGYLEVFLRVSDYNNKILIQDLNSTNESYVVPASKDELHPMIGALRVFIREGKLRVSSKCTALISQLKYGLWNKDRKDLARQSGHHNDHLMALVYLIRHLSEHNNPIPKNYKINPELVWIAPAEDSDLVACNEFPS